MMTTWAQAPPTMSSGFGTSSIGTPVGPATAPAECNEAEIQELDIDYSEILDLRRLSSTLSRPSSPTWMTIPRLRYQRRYLSQHYLATVPRASIVNTAYMLAIF